MYIYVYVYIHSAPPAVAEEAEDVPPSWESRISRHVLRCRAFLVFL